MKQEDADPGNLVLRAADAFNAERETAPLTCGTESCQELSVCIAYWPGQTIRLCGFCTIRAMNIAEHMGFRLKTELDDGRELEARR